MLGRLKWDPDMGCRAGRALWIGENPRVLVKGTPLHPLQCFCEVALPFLWLISFFLFYFEGFFLVLESKFFVPDGTKSEGYLC